MASYGLRTKDALARVTLDTSIAPIRSIKMLQVTCNGSFEQTFSIPEIKADSFVVVDTLAFDTDDTTWSPQAFWSTGQLIIRRGYTRTWQVMIMSSNGEPYSATGQYGIRTLNNGLRSQIDPVNRVLNVLYKGSFRFNAYGDTTPIINGYDFPTPITTYERPLVFVNGPGHLMLQKFRIMGSPGNWTGWRVGRYAHPNFGPVWLEGMTVDWFVASYSAGSIVSGSYGAVVRGADGVGIFSTTNNIAQMNSQPFSNSFAVAGAPITGTGYYAASSQMTWTNNPSDYFLANALLSITQVTNAGTVGPWRINIAGFLNGNRQVIQAYTENASAIDPVPPNGRTLFAARTTI